MNRLSFARSKETVWTGWKALRISEGAVGRGIPVIPWPFPWPPLAADIGAEADDEETTGDDEARGVGRPASGMDATAPGDGSIVQAGGALVLVLDETGRTSSLVFPAANDRDEYFGKAAAGDNKVT